MRRIYEPRWVFGVQRDLAGRRPNLVQVLSISADLGAGTAVAAVPEGLAAELSNLDLDLDLDLGLSSGGSPAHAAGSAAGGAAGTTAGTAAGTIDGSTPGRGLELLKAGACGNKLLKLITGEADVAVFNLKTSLWCASCPAAIAMPMPTREATACIAATSTKY